MTKLFYAASAAAILTVAGHLPAMAQSSTTGTMSPTITCRDISTMDRDMARGVVFYVSGFQAASGRMQNQASASGTSGTSGSSSTTESTAADAGSSTSGSSGSDVTGSTSSAGGTTDAGGTASSGTTDTASGTSGSSSTASGASGGASSAVVAQLPGFSTVDIDKIMSDCASSPDRQLSEMIGQGGAATGTTTP